MVPWEGREKEVGVILERSHDSDLWGSYQAAVGIPVQAAGFSVGIIVNGPIEPGI